MHITGFYPCNDCILVERDQADEVTPGGIILPGNAQQKPSRGTVIEVGPGPRLEDGTRADMAISPGDRVYFAAWAGQEVELAGEKLLIVREKDVYGTFTEG